MSADATNTILEPEEAGGRTILLGWIRGFRPGGGWNGTLSLPRVLTFAEDGVPVQQPLPELAKLRAYETLSVGGESPPLGRVGTRQALSVRREGECWGNGECGG